MEQQGDYKDFKLPMKELSAHEIQFENQIKIALLKALKDGDVLNDWQFDESLKMVEGKGSI